MFATSVPAPPVGPPPAFVGGSFFGGAFVATVGVAGAAALRGVGFRFACGGMSRGFVWARGGGGAGVGGGAGAGCGVTSPIARGPGGAATRLTLYTGGSAFGGAGRANT